MRLSVSRKTIDQIDQQIIDLLAQRSEVVKTIAVYKRIHHLPALDAERWNAVLTSVLAMGTAKGLSEQFILDLRNRIHQESLSLELK